jgi:glycerophosphoryl diester phosphodiesterase
MLPQAFIRPIAHRGLHDRDQGVIENSRGAFAAAIAGGYGIECDLQPARDGTPIVHHDETLERLTARSERLDALAPSEIAKTTYSIGGEPIIAYRDLLDLVQGRVPLLVEIKSDWSPPRIDFLDAIAGLTLAYRGPLALMSFDPVVVAALRQRAPDIPRGIVSGSYRSATDDDWWADVLSADRRARLADLIEWREAAPDFVAYHVDALPTPVTHFIRHALGLPLFTWTVRTAAQRERASAHADAPIFETWRP